jgi:hypothetical protein
MPSPVDILNDPNYINADLETKKAIFNAGVASLPDYRRANSATQADIRRQFGIETSKERYTRQQAKQRADEKSALRSTGSKIASAVSGVERGLKPIAEKLSYLNPLEYIPVGASDKTKKRLAQFAAERQQANPVTFAGGKLGGEIAGTLPLTMGGGAVIQGGGRLLSKVMPRAGAVVEKFGRAVTSGGTRVAAPTKTAVKEGKIIAGSRKARVALRAAAGSASSLIAAAATDQDLTDAALAGATVPVLGHMLKFGAGKTYDVIMSRAGPVEAARILREVIDQNAVKIEKALRNAPKDIKANTAEFLAARGLLTPELAAATKIASGTKQSGPLLDVALERGKGQKRMTDIIRGGADQTNAMANIAAAKQQMQVATAPMREGALELADIGRTQIIPAEQAALRARAALQNELDTAARYMDDPNFDARIRKYSEDARSAEEVAANLRAQGLAPLDISNVVRNLRAEADKAQFVSPNRSAVLSEFANNLERRAAKLGGYIDAQGINLARREMNTFVSNILDTSDPQALREGTAQLIAAAKGPIDDAIEAAGGRGWKSYLNNFAEGMKGIERLTLQRKLTQFLPEEEGTFAEIMSRQNPEFVESVLGTGRFDIDTELLQPVLGTAKQLGRDIEAQQAVAATGLEGLSPSQRLGFEQGVTARVGEKLEPTIPNIATLGARIAGGLPHVYGGGIAAQECVVQAAQRACENTMRNLVPALASPRQAGELLRVRPAEDYISKFLYGSQSAPPLVAAPRQFAPRTAQQAVANRNALTPAQQAIINRNNRAHARQQAVVQTGVAGLTPATMGEEFNFPDFDPETGEPLINIDYSEGYPVPIYGRVSANKMRR